MTKKQSYLQKKRKQTIPKKKKKIMTKDKLELQKSFFMKKQRSKITRASYLGKPVAIYLAMGLLFSTACFLKKG